MNRVESTVSSSSRRGSLHWNICILAITLCCSALLPSVTASPPLVTNVVVSATNTTSFTFDVVFNADAAPIGDDEQLFLDVLIQPAEGNATEQFLPLTNPMQVILTGLLPDSIYSFTFQTHNNNGRNSSDVFNLQALRTYRLGPQIIGLFASDPSPTTDPSDSLFSNGDVITIAFDQDTNQPAPLDNKDAIAKYFSFSQPIGDVYSAAWGDARTLNILIVDVGQGAPNLGLGYLTVSVVGPIFSPDGKSDISSSTSPPLIGSWAAIDANYFQPINPVTQQVITNPDFRAYLATSLVNQDTTLPIKLIFPSTANKGGYMIAAAVVFPKDLDLIGFSLKGQNFTTPSTSIGTDSGARAFTNDFLSTISSSVVLTPKKDYVGYSCVQFQLYDRSNGYAIVDTSFVNVRFAPPPPLAIPELQLGSPPSDATSNPITLVKKNQTAIIIGVCVTLGVILLAILSVCGWKRYKSWKGERDFEGVTQPTLEAADKDAGPTRRFYFDSKM